jgi:hypothetical protein
VRFAERHYAAVFSRKTGASSACESSSTIERPAHPRGKVRCPKEHRLLRVERTCDAAADRNDRLAAREAAHGVNDRTHALFEQGWRVELYRFTERNGVM